MNYIIVCELLCLLIKEYNRLVDKLKNKYELDENQKKKIYQREIGDYIRKNSMLSVKKQYNKTNKTYCFKEKIKLLYIYYNINMLPHEMRINYIRNILETCDYGRIYKNKDFLMYTENHIGPNNKQYLQLYNKLQHILPDKNLQNNPNNCKNCYEINNVLYFDGNSGMYFRVLVVI